LYVFFAEAQLLFECEFLCIFDFLHWVKSYCVDYSYTQIYVGSLTCHSVFLCGLCTQIASVLWFTVRIYHFMTMISTSQRKTLDSRLGIGSGYWPWVWFFICRTALLFKGGEMQLGLLLLFVCSKHLFHAGRSVIVA
jgi:hypothetical protein